LVELLSKKQLAILTTNMTYSASVTMSRARFSHKGQNTVTFVREDRRMGPVTNSIVLVVLVCLLGMLYLTQVTHTNSLSYKINSLQKKQADLKDEKQNLELSSARLQSIESIKSSQAASKLVSATPVAVAP
jgi:uncharacterized membrane protein